MRTATRPPEPNVGAFGEKLRKQREQRGLDLDAISNTTKINTRMLRALEEEHFDQLPGGVFNKGFVRAYARQVGLDEEEAVADYLAAARESQLQPQSDFRAPAPKLAPDAAPGLGGTVLTQGLPPGNDDAGSDQNQQLRIEDRRHNEDRRHRNKDHRIKDQKYPAGDPAQPADQSSAPIPWGKLALALLLVTLLLAFWNFRRHAQPSAASPAVASSNRSAAPASAPASAAAQPSGSASSPTVAPAAGSASTPAANVPLDAKPPATHAAALAAAAKPPSTFTLLIRADESTWISLIADGKPVAQETLIAPAHTSVRATREIVVKTGNAAGVSFLLNGKEIPAQGNEGEVKTYIFDATGLRPAPQSQPPGTNR